MVRWFLLLLVLLSLGLIGFGLCGRVGMMFSRSIWTNNLPAAGDPLIYVSFSRSSLDDSRPLYNHDPLANAIDTPLNLSDVPPDVVPRNGAGQGLYLYQPIQNFAAYAQIPVVERDSPPGIFEESSGSIYGVWVPAGQHGFNPVDPRTKEPLTGNFALLVTGSEDVTSHLNWQWRQEQSWTYFVAGAGLFAAVFFGWKTQPAAPDSLKPFAVHLMSESPPWWVISRAFGVVCILLGVVSILSSPVGSNAMERGFFTPLVIAMAFLGAPLGWMIVGFGAQLFHRNVAAAMRRKNRAPILYLRSFQSDARWLEQPIDLLWMLLFPGRFETQERSLTKALSGVGPLIAIGQPGELLPPMGAARLYVKHDKWQEVVAHMARISGLIMLRIGKTDSFWWEVEHVVDTCPPEKIIFMLPRGDTFRAYDALARHLAPRLKQLFPQPTTDMQFVGFRKDWSPVVLGRHSTSLMSCFRTFLIGSAAPVLRDELLPALRHCGYRVGRLPPLLREWVLILLVVGFPLAFLGMMAWIFTSNH